MSTLFLLPSWPTFIEVWTHRLIENLEPGGVIIASYPPTEPLWQGRVRVIEIDEVQVPQWQRELRRLRLPIDTRTKSPALRRAINSDSVSEVLVNYLDFALRCEKMWGRTSKPLFVHCHGYDTTWDLRRPQSPDRPVYSPEYFHDVRELSKKALLITSSHCGAQRLLDIGVSKDRVRVKYLGVLVPSAPIQRPLHGKKIEILYLGRLVDCKGPDFVIRAFDLACQRGLDARLTVAGDGPLRNLCIELQQRSKFRERINLIGAVDFAKGEYLRSQSDIFTAHNCLGRITHQEEVYGVSFVEAMAAGLPVVSGRSGGLVETVIDGVTGLLIEPGDIDAHSQALLQLAHNPELRERMGVAGWKRARDLFSQERERLELRRILGEKSKPDRTEGSYKLADLA